MLSKAYLRKNPTPMISAKAPIRFKSFPPMSCSHSCFDRDGGLFPGAIAGCATGRSCPGGVGRCSGIGEGRAGEGGVCTGRARAPDTGGAAA